VHAPSLCSHGCVLRTWPSLSWRACVVWLHDMCAVWLHDLCNQRNRNHTAHKSYNHTAHKSCNHTAHNSCVVCSYITRGRCVRDEDASRRFRSCTGHQVGSFSAVKAQEHRQLRSHDSDALVLNKWFTLGKNRTSLVNWFWMQSIGRTGCYGKPVGHPDEWVKAHSLTCCEAVPARPARRRLADVSRLLS